MKNLSLIAAIGKNNELGVDNHLIWRLKDDLKYFKNITTGKTIIMGRKCFESLPGLLPDRKSVILTSNKKYDVENALICHNIEEIFDYITTSQDDCFIIGGEQIYDLFLPYCERLYLTEINAVEPNADAYFPEFDRNNYEKSIVGSGMENNISYDFVIYRRK